MKITIVGIGMGGFGTLTTAARLALESAELVIGAKRVLECLPPSCLCDRHEAVAPEAIKEIINNSAAVVVCVAMSGDTGFYSGTKKLLPLLAGVEVEVLPGIATVQYMAARLGRPWQSALLTSAHGTRCNVVGSLVAAREVFLLTGGEVTPRTIIEELNVAGLPGVTVHVGENLSSPQERIVSGSLKQLAGQDFAPLSAVWLEREPLPEPHAFVTGGIPDELFLRGEVPMTKQEVRAVALAKLGVAEKDILWDVGAGTGSVSVEMAYKRPFTQVYAVEENPAACELILANRQSFGVYNVTLAQGAAPDMLAELPDPDAVFIGGSKGRLRDIIEVVARRSPMARVVVTAIALETLGEAVAVLGGAGFTEPDITQVSVSRACAVGGSHLLTAQNPIFIISARGKGA